MCFQREREGERGRVEIYVHVFRALTLANDLLGKALTKLSVSMFDISLSSQHLVFVFDAPKWLLTRPASVPAPRNEEMLRRCIEPADAVVPLLPGIRRAPRVVLTTVACSQLQPASFHSLHRVSSARHRRRVSAVAAGQTYLPVCAHLRRDLYPFKLPSISSGTTTSSHADGERHTFPPRRGQLCSAGDRTLPAGTSEGRKV